MNKLYSLLAPLIFFFATAQAQTDNKVVADIKCNTEDVFRMFEKFHCSPRTENEQLYQDIAGIFVTHMDPAHILLTAGDVQQLNNYQALKDDLNGVNHHYSETAIAIYRKRLKDAQKTLEDLAGKPFDFSKDESVALDLDSSDFAADEKELARRMYLHLKFQTLDRLSEDALKDSLTDKKTILLQEPAERGVVFKIRERRLKRRLEIPVGFENLVRSMLYDAIADAFDPHSEFIGAVETKRIKQGWGANAHSFGLRLKENEKGDVVIASLIAGSSAWKSGELNQGDVLVKLQWKDKPVVDLEGEDIDEVEEEFAALKGLKAQLTVRKADGTEVTVTLLRRYANSGEEIVKAFILDGPKKIGYIMLPSFYSSWESSDASGCAKDVIKQTVKLVSKQVKGLILDLRYNGGGSVQEADELAGIFLDDGPLAFRKQKDGFLITLKDPIPGVLYDDPILVLVNGESASASEYLASTLQDYHRAIIVGSPTYGKATVQRYLPVDTTISKVDLVKGHYDTESKDEVKITISKLYRVTGKSNQLLGLKPDILLPDENDSLKIRERFNKCALVTDTLSHGGKFDAFNAYPVQQLAAKSAARVQSAGGFKKVEHLREIAAEVRRSEKNPVSLKFDSYFDFNKNHAGLARRLMKELREDSTDQFKVINTEEDAKVLKWDPELVEINANFCRRVARNIYVNEAYAIMSDYLEMKK